MQTIEYDDDEGTKETLHYIGKVPMQQVFDTGIVEGSYANGRLGPLC